MGLEEEFASEYKNNRRQLEEEEEFIKTFKRKGDQALEQAYHELSIQTRNNDLDAQTIAFIRQEIFKAQEDYEEIIGQERKNVIQRLDNNELEHRQKLRQNN
ncbi:hypothetical protein [Carnobacterium divergens]|uniref:hypothetical protein n=1 Tax=Carnobacterium divergens TaxID=2748 RepID=UPI0007F34872|nr:hypothetical protein [Carnobacterium divergens]SBO16855.1 conserved hypothetical protein [Carnobacterium divergens]